MSLRPQVVPRRVEEEGEAGGCWHGATGGADGAASVEGVVAAGGDGVESVAVAALLRQQAERRVLAAIHDPASIARVLLAMGLSSVVPEQAGCRAPPTPAGDALRDVDHVLAGQWRRPAKTR